MKNLFPVTNLVFSDFIARMALALVSIAVLSGGLFVTSTDAQTNQDVPEIAPIGVPVGKYMNIPASAMGPAVDPAKGYRSQELGKGLYMVTDNAYQSLFMVYEKGVVVIDAPPTYAQYIRKAISEVTNKPITHVIYSHSHSDHIGGAKSLGGSPVIIAHEETKRLLARAKDANRPLPTVTFRDRYTLKAGSQILDFPITALPINRAIYSSMRPLRKL